jgi:hypothetical protein
MLPEVRAIRRAIRADTEGLFLSRYERNPNNVYEGYCYVASEAFFHMVGGEGYTPMYMTVCDALHWFVRGPDGEVINPTADQFENTPPYTVARGCGFLTRRPSKKCRALIDAASVYLET